MSRQDSIEADDTIILRLKRAAGQVNGTIAMYENERRCLDVVRQLMAARSALASVARELLTEEAGRCRKEHKYEDLDIILKELLR